MFCFKGYSLTVYTIHLLLTSDLVIALLVYKSLDLLLISSSEFYLMVINV